MVVFVKGLPYMQYANVSVSIILSTLGMFERAVDLNDVCHIPEAVREKN